MSAYKREIDGPRYSRAAEAGFILLGFCLGIPGILIDWAIARRERRMECSAEGIWLGIIGWAFGIALWYILFVAGVLPLGSSVWCLLVGSFGGVTLGLAGVTVGEPYGAPGNLSTLWFVGAILFICLADMWVYGMRYKMSAQEKARELPGDDWVKPGERHLRYDSGVTIDAPAERVWAYVKQSGQTQAGWYSFDWLERLFTFKIYNHYDIHPEWQNLKPGDFQWFHQPPLSIGE